MKRGLLLSLTFLFLIGFASATCNLKAELVNQDPYPATPGEYVKLVFQLNGIENSDCGLVKFELIEDYPIKFDPDSPRVVSVQAGTSAFTYKGFLLAPYKVRVDGEALDGDNPIQVRYTSSKLGAPESYLLQEFDLNVENVKTDFEISVKNYDLIKKEITFEILNIGKHDVEALTVEIPEQENILVKGSNRNIVGSLDSNEDTTFSFEATPKQGEIILKILYTDKTNTRRNIEEKIVFNSAPFENRVNGESGGSSLVWVIIVLVLILGFVWWRVYVKRKKAHELRMRLAKHK